MSDTVHKSVSDYETNSKSKRSKRLGWVYFGFALLVGSGAAIIYSHHDIASAPAGKVLLPTVTVSEPLRDNVDTRGSFIGQFSAVNRVELRAQVGGTLSEIHFSDGNIVHKGDLLFVIDPRPYDIKLQQAKSELSTAKARLALANSQLSRAETLQKDQWTAVATLDQRISDQSAARAAVDDAEARIRDAQLDLEYSRITAPFTGRIGARAVSVGSLVAGSRAGTGTSSLLATLISLDPIYVNFDMSEADHMMFARERQYQSGPLARTVDITLSDENEPSRTGTLDFLDNSLDRSSGTLHARATVPNNDFLLTPGSFARVSVVMKPAAPALLVPDAAVLPDQAEHVVLTVGADNVVTPKQVELGDLRSGLRVIRSGLFSTDKIIIEGIPAVRAGSKVTVERGAIQFASGQHGG